MIGEITEAQIPTNVSEASTVSPQEEIEKRLGISNNREFNYFVTRFGSYSSLFGAQLRFNHGPLIGVSFSDGVFAWATETVSHADIENAEMSRVDKERTKISPVAWIGAREYRGKTQRRQIDVFVTDTIVADNVVRLLQACLKSISSKSSTRPNFLLKVDLKEREKMLLVYKGNLSNFQLPDLLTKLPEDQEFYQKGERFYRPNILDGRVVLFNPDSDTVTSGFSDNEVCAILKIKYPESYKNIVRLVRVSNNVLVVSRRDSLDRPTAVKLARVMLEAGEHSDTMLSFINGQSETIGNLAKSGDGEQTKVEKPRQHSFTFQIPDAEREFLHFRTSDQQLADAYAEFASNFAIRDKGITPEEAKDFFIRKVEFQISSTLSDDKATSAQVQKIKDQDKYSLTLFPEAYKKYAFLFSHGLGGFTGFNVTDYSKQTIEEKIATWRDIFNYTMRHEFLHLLQCQTGVLKISDKEIEEAERAEQAYKRVLHVCKACTAASVLAVVASTAFPELETATKIATSASSATFFGTLLLRRRAVSKSGVNYSDVNAKHEASEDQAEELADSKLGEKLIKQPFSYIHESG